MTDRQGIIFGPWVGEFGWELFSWHAYCRSISKGYDYCIAISRPGNDVLYKDFCETFIAFEPPAGGVADSHKHSMCQDFNASEFLKAVVPIELLREYTWNWLPPTKIGHPPYDHYRKSLNISTNMGTFSNVIPDYKVLRGPVNDETAGVDIVIHARNRTVRTIDNWPEEKWIEVVNSFPDLSFASIGTAGSSLHVEGTKDLRGISTDLTVGVLQRAKCIAGPSSGPLHLASLSGCPQVVWTSNPNQNYQRYKYCWNPFHVDVSMFKGPDPEISDVVEMLKNYT